MPTGKFENQIDRPAAFAIAVWLLAQVAVLGLCAARVQIFSRAPAATEQITLPAMIAVQVATSALIFPHLLRSLRSTTLAMASMWPLAQLASNLSDAPASALIRAELYVSIWLIALFLWNQSLTTKFSRLLGIASAGMISIGGPILYYLQSEFAASTAHNPTGFAGYGPLAGAVSQIFSASDYGPWVELGVFSSCAAAALTLFYRSRQVIH